MRARARLPQVVLAAAAVAALVQTAAVAQQSHPGTAKPKFDVSRLADSEGMFETFHVAETQPLRQVLTKGILKDDTRVLVTETAAGKLALITDQMAYHHIAQGVAGGKQWMATF